MIPTACAEDYGKVSVTDPVAVEGTSREAMLVREIEARVIFAALLGNGPGRIHLMRTCSNLLICSFILCTGRVLCIESH